MESQNVILVKLWKSLSDAGLLDSGVSISASDETNIDTACQTLYNYSPDALACISQINTHCVRSLFWRWLLEGTSPRQPCMLRGLDKLTGGSKNLTLAKGSQLSAQSFLLMA